MPLSRPRVAMPHARAVVLVMLFALAATAIAVVRGEPAHARPQRTIAQVSALLDRLSKQNEMLDERYNQAVAAVTAQQHVARKAAREARAAARAAQQARDRLSAAAALRYESGSMDPTGMLLTSENPQAYLDDLSAMDYLSSQLSMLASRAVSTAKQSHAASRRASAELVAVQAKARTVRTQRTALAARTSHFKQVLATLTAEQRRRYELARSVAIAKAQAIARAQALAQARGRAKAPAVTTKAPTVTTPPVAAPPPTSSATVQRVIAYAEAQVGKSYAYGGTGPYSYDCSGLTMMSWLQGGLHLPHQASAQYNVGRHISYDQLQPGDLIFLYSPIGHVEIYVGNDLAVSAADPALGVVYVHPSHDMADYVGATRPQG